MLDWGPVWISMCLWYSHPFLRGRRDWRRSSAGSYYFKVENLSDLDAVSLLRAMESQDRVGLVVRSCVPSGWWPCLTPCFLGIRK